MTTSRSMLPPARKYRQLYYWYQFIPVASESTEAIGTAGKRYLAAVLTLFLLTGCANRVPVNSNLVAPYPADKTWAVAPLVNAAGTTAADGTHLSDLLTQELQQVYRINVLPVNAVLEAMQALKIHEIKSVHEAQSIVRLLKIDGLIVGNITAYNPYSPPVLGLTLQLYTSGNEINPDAEGASINSTKGIRTLGASPSDFNVPGVRSFTQPVASATAIVNAADNAVRLDLKRFAEARTDPNTALGWRKFLYSMDAYAQYVGHRLIRELLAAERRRLGSRQPNSRRNPVPRRAQAQRIGSTPPR